MTLPLWELRAISQGHAHRYRDILNMIRNLGYWMLSGFGGEKFTRSTDVTDLIHFSWDKNIKTVNLSDEEIDDLRRSMREENLRNGFAE